eukprot:scaffold36045_cov20-Tisochrysis_lutea.AAC.2
MLQAHCCPVDPQTRYLQSSVGKRGLEPARIPVQVEISGIVCFETMYVFLLSGTDQQDKQPNFPACVKPS